MLRAKWIRSGAWLALVAVGCRPSAVASRQASVDVDAYLAAKAQHVRVAQSRIADAGLRQYVDSAVKDLEARLRAIVGTAPLGGRSTTFHPGLVREGTEGGEVDALRLGGFSRDTIVLLTHRDLLAAWVRAEGDSAADAYLGLARPDVLTWVLGWNAAVSVYADLRKGGALPDEVRMALLVSHSQDQISTTPERFMIAVERENLVYIIVARALPVRPPPECVERHKAAIFNSEYTPGPSIDGRHEGFLSCFDSLASRQPDYPGAIHAVNDLLRILPPTRR